MEVFGIKRFSYGAVLAFVVLLVLLVAGAMFFADEAEDFFGLHEPAITQAMELRGSWLGMKLASLDSPTARHLGVPPAAKGVMIVEIEERNGWRARQAGAMEGDVIVAVDEQDIRDLADLYDVSRNLDVGGAVLLDIRRWGQPMTLVLPALLAQPAAANPSQFGQAGPAMAPGANAAWVQPAATVQGVQGPQFYCPTHNRVWPQNAVHPHYRCPLGNCPLSRTR
ncbi:MAG: hypothetical protein ACYSWU_01015 [Planctomycetota bacterium]|jgi:hypothetical protein